MEFGTALKTLRKERGLTQQQLASLLQTSKQVISRYENGQRSPKISAVAAYASILNVPMSYFSGESCSDACPASVPPGYCCAPSAHAHAAWDDQLPALCEILSRRPEMRALFDSIRDAPDSLVQDMLDYANARKNQTQD